MIERHWGGGEVEEDGEVKWRAIVTTFKNIHILISLSNSVICLKIRCTLRRVILLTLMPGMMPFCLMSSTKEVPSSLFWYTVSWKRITPEMYSETACKQNMILTLLNLLLSGFDSTVNLSLKISVLYVAHPVIISMTV